LYHKNRVLSKWWRDYTVSRINSDSINSDATKNNSIIQLQIRLNFKYNSVFTTADTNASTQLSWEIRVVVCLHSPCSRARNHFLAANDRSKDRHFVRRSASFSLALTSCSLQRHCITAYSITIMLQSDLTMDILITGDHSFCKIIIARRKLNVLDPIYRSYIYGIHLSFALLRI
jgi:hypothetical protein